MADVKELNINNTTYTIKDAVARSGLTSKQDTLVSGTNIKTINGNSLLGSGDITIQGGGATRNIGEIVASTIPLTDAGLHLLDGALLQYGSYQAFIDYIAGLVSTYPNLFVTESAWQAAVTTYGVCGKFVYDSVANTVRLPKVTGIIEGTTDLTALGDLVEAGLPNITGNGKWIHESGTGTGAIYSEAGNLNQQASGSGGEAYNKVYFDASRSSSIYGNSNTVQPQTIKVLYYIVIATTTKTEIEVDIDEVVTDLNGKADVDLTNLTNAGEIVGSSLGMPSSTYDDLTLGASGTTYTAPANGWFFLNKIADYQYIALVNQTAGHLTSESRSFGNGVYLNIYIPAHKGDVVMVDYGANGATIYFRFIYAVGSESEAS